MSRITPSDVAYVARLARLALSDAEIQAMTHDLEQILGHAVALAALPTEGVPPTAHGFDLATPSRPDEAAQPMDPALAVSNAPDPLGTAFLVPKVLVEEG